MRNNFLINRRTCLKGIGAALALPLLESMGWADAGKGKAVQAAGSPRIHVHAPRGHHGSVLARRSGEFPVVAAAGPGIAASRARSVSVDEGHLGRADRSVQWRAACARTVHLAHGACCRMRTQRNRINIAISADQIAANYVGAFTSLPSLELATMPQTHKENQEGLNEGYYSHCSFRSPTQAVPAEINPRSVLNRLFGKSDQTRTHRARRTRWIGRCWIWSSAAPKTFAGSCPRTTSTNWMNTWTACAPWNAASPPSNIRQKEAALEKAGVSVEQTQRFGFPAHRDQDSRGRQTQRVHAGDVRPQRAGVPDRHDPRQHLHRLHAERRFLSGTRVQRTSITPRPITTTKPRRSGRSPRSPPSTSPSSPTW